LPLLLFFRLFSFHFQHGNYLFVICEKEAKQPLTILRLLMFKHFHIILRQAKI
jgi:hypothetical protein